MSQINFLPESYRRRHARRRRRPVEFVVIALTLAGLLALWANSGGPDRSLAQQVDALDARIAKIQQLRDEQEQLEAQRSELQRQLMTARETYQPLTMTQALARLSALMPEPIRLIDLELENDRPKPEALPNGATPTNRRVVTSAGQSQGTTQATPAQPNLLKINLTGHAPSDEEIVDLIRRLSSDPVFSTVALRGSKVDQTQTHYVREFKLYVVIDLDRRFVQTGDKGDKR